MHFIKIRENCNFSFTFVFFIAHCVCDKQVNLRQNFKLQ